MAFDRAPFSRLFQGTLQHRGQFVQGKRFGQIIGRTGAHGLDRRRHGGECRHDHHHQGGIERLDLVQQLQALLERSAEIEQQNIDALTTQQGTRRGNAGNGLRHKTQVGRYFAARRTNRGVLVDDE